ncbi:hypothetical protein SRHO_G00103830 [Serrasalmus rhombeus]
MASSQDRALQALSSELAPLDRQITALLKRQDELLQQKSQLEASREVSLSVVAPASTLRTPGDAVLTPAPAPPGPWERQCRRRPSRPSPPPQPVFTSCNRFAALSSPPTPSPTPRAPSPAPAPRHSAQDSVYVIGARVLDIAKRLPSALRRRDASDRRSEVMKEHYQTLLDTARKKTDARIVISGPLPTYRRGSERFSGLFALQSWLRGWCACNGLGYVDNWSSFWEQPALYRRDGLHSSPLGSVVLSRNIERAIR